MHNILRQKNQELKDVVTLVVAKNDKGEIDLSKNAEAFDLLDSQKEYMNLEVFNLVKIKG